MSIASWTGSLDVDVFRNDLDNEVSLDDILSPYKI